MFGKGRRFKHLRNPREKSVPEKSSQNPYPNDVFYNRNLYTNPDWKR